MSSLPVLAVATSNGGKLRELTALLGNAATLRPLAELGMTLPEETGASFEENARAKAHFVATTTGMLTMADDSGLEVDALGGEPGIRTARYAGPQARDEENRRLLLERMDGVPPLMRSARFVCVIAIADAAGSIATASGICEGSISMRPMGTGGFGYDPIFLLPDGRTMAELTTGEKNDISHRGIALKRSLPVLLGSLERGTLDRRPEVPV